MTNLPVTGSFSVTAIYGQKGKYWADGHKGIDMVCENKNVYATCDGTVRTVSYDANGWGYYVSIGDANGYRHIFCHLKEGSIKVKKGDRVDRSTVIGTMGATGNVTGVHLHYQLQKGETVVDPTTHLGIPNRIGTYHSDQYQIKSGAKFKDDAAIPAWAKEAVEKVAAKGLMAGDAEGTFRPNDPVTRAELAVILARME
ncbi:MAG: peptidoglycan DD-metalloendopeptidase family protein [Clostridia bacterium]|nr:peptidoglycan DD-metalloendopeptidase family protein [Clostridia bacterium]